MSRVKPNVTVSAGITVIVEDDTGAQHKFTCSGSNEVTKKPAKEVIKALQDCLEEKVKAVTSSKRRK